MTHRQRAAPDHKIGAMAVSNRYPHLLAGRAGKRAIEFTALGALAVLLSGCMSSNTNTVQPLTPVPTTAVSSSALPQPITIGQPVVDPQTQTLSEAAGVESATLDPALDGQNALPATGAATASPVPSADANVSEDDLIGAWSASTPSATCSINLSLTNWTGGYRASTRNCGDVQLSTLSAWAVEGQQVLLKGTDGTPLARLFRTGGTRYAGQLESGQAVTVFR